MYTFRKAEKSDVNNIVKLVESAYRGEKSRTGWTTEADLLDGQRTDCDEVESLIKKEHSEIILCEQRGRLLGSANLKNKANYVYLGMFAVSPKMQARGIGKSFLGYIEEFVRQEWNAESIEMAVISQRVELIKWYEKQGYEKTGEQRAFPYGDTRFGIPKRDDLVLEVLKKRLLKAFTANER